MGKGSKNTLFCLYLETEPTWLNATTSNVSLMRMQVDLPCLLVWFIDLLLVNIVITKSKNVHLPMVKKNEWDGICAKYLAREYHWRSHYTNGSISNRHTWDTITRWMLEHQCDRGHCWWSAWQFENVIQLGFVVACMVHFANTGWSIIAMLKCYL